MEKTTKTKQPGWILNWFTKQEQLDRLTKTYKNHEVAVENINEPKKS